MGSTGNREKFGQALYCAKDDSLKDIHRLTCTLGTLYQSFERAGLSIPLLVRRGGCGIKKISAKPTLLPQTGWSLTRVIRCERPPRPLRVHPSSRGGE